MMGERELVGLAGLLFLFILIGLRIPVALSMLVAGILGSFALSIAAPFLKFGPYILQFKSSLWNNIANYDLSVVPLFILMGFLAAESGLSRDLFAGFSALLGESEAVWRWLPSAHARALVQLVVHRSRQPVR